ERLSRAIYLPDGVVAVAEPGDVGDAARPYIHAVLLGRDDSRRALESAFLDQQGLREERLDRARRNRRDRLVGEGARVGARQKLDRVACGGGLGCAATTTATGAAGGGGSGLTETQLRRGHAAVEHQHVARRDVVRIPDLLLVHAPDLGPAPLVFEKLAG